MKQKKRSLYVLHTESIYSRGGEKYLFELLKRVAKKYTITLYVHAISPEWKRLYNQHHIIIKVLWKPYRFFWLLLPMTLIINCIKLKKTIKPDDVVFATNFPMNFLAVIVSKRTICHCFEPLAIFYDPIRISSLSKFSKFCVTVAKLLYSSLDKWAYNKSTIFTALGPSVEPYIKETYNRSPDLYLPNGVDGIFFSPAKKKTASPQKPYVIGHSTDYTIFKGTWDFLAMITHLKHTSLHFIVHISESISDKKIQKKYLDYIRKHHIESVISFIGNLDEKALVNFYRSLDVFVYSGSPESAGGSTASLSVLEAQACGIPVIRSGGDDHEIMHGTTGFYINPHDSKQGSSMLYSFLNKSQKQKMAMQTQARAYMVRQFDWNQTSNTFIHAVNKLFLPPLV